MLKTLRISVEQREVVIDGRIGSVLAYGINEGLHQDQGRFFLSFEVSVYEPKVVRGDGEMRIHPLREGLYIILVPVSGPDAGFTVAVTPKKT